MVAHFGISCLLPCLDAALACFDQSKFQLRVCGGEGPKKVIGSVKGTVALRHLFLMARLDKFCVSVN